MSGGMDYDQGDEKPIISEKQGRDNLESNTDIIKQGLDSQH